MFGLGAQELILILLIALVLFVARRFRRSAALSGRRSASSTGVWRPRTRPPGPSPRTAPGRTDRSRRDAGGLGGRECLTPGRPRL